MMIHLKSHIEMFEASNQNPGSSYASYMRNNYHQGSGEESKLQRDIENDWALRKALNPVDRAMDNFYMKCREKLKKKLGRDVTESEATDEFDKHWMKNRERLVRAEKLKMEGRNKPWEKSDKVYDTNKKTGIME